MYVPNKRANLFVKIKICIVFDLGGRNISPWTSFHPNSSWASSPLSIWLYLNTGIRLITNQNNYSNPFKNNLNLANWHIFELFYLACVYHNISLFTIGLSFLPLTNVLKEQSTRLMQIIVRMRPFWIPLYTVYPTDILSCYILVLSYLAISLWRVRSKIIATIPDKKRTKRYYSSDTHQFNNLIKSTVGL